MIDFLYPSCIADKNSGKETIELASNLFKKRTQRELIFSQILRIISVNVLSCLASYQGYMEFFYMELF